MRLWSLHPKYLDARGLVALWREALLAQAVLRKRTNGYHHHPQLHRFRASSSPVGLIAEYLRRVHDEAKHRGYRFAAAKIGRVRARGTLTVTRAQLAYEWQHLLRKLKLRDPRRFKRFACAVTPDSHPLFRVVRGGIAEWEKITPPQRRRRKMQPLAAEED
ncbi:MAG: pyrimidine dimer DNA glycosylase/endonuclease V [Planctomycetes bacterium]|nr:pyrimidine dimer DNA glycosylase/endonuclease V [Planctomycetota bacterium]